METSLSTSVSTSTLIDRLILRYEIHSGVDVTIDDLIASRKLNLELTEGNDYCVMVEAGMFTSFSKEVKEALASEEHTKNRIALALLVKNGAQEMVANLYLKINKPKGITKIFKSEEDALTWLQQKRDEYYENK
jgi:hypothetical protein